MELIIPPGCEDSAKPQKGYQANTDLVYLEVPGGLHELSTWETVLPDFLRFAFPVE